MHHVILEKLQDVVGIFAQISDGITLRELDVRSMHAKSTTLPWNPIIFLYYSNYTYLDRLDYTLINEGTT